MPCRTGGGSMATPANWTQISDDEEQRAHQLHADSIIIDGLIPTDVYLANPDYRGNLQEGGMTATNFTIASWPHDYAGATDEIMRCHEFVEQHADDFTLAESADDIRAAKENGQLAAIIGFQDAKPVQKNLRHLQAFERMGVRIIQLTYNTQNYVGSGCCERNDSGLSHFGRDVVKEMNDRGILVDLSHCADETTMDAIEAASDPVTFNHVGARAINHAYGRGKTDEQLKAVAETGGVIGVLFASSFLKRDPDTHEVLPASIDDILDHVDYIVDLVGVDHVGFGSDLNDHAYDVGKTPETSSFRHWRPTHPEVFGSGPTDRYDPPPEGLERHTELLNFTRGLVSRGYSDTEIKKILGGNFLRVFEDVWNG